MENALRLLTILFLSFSTLFCSSGHSRKGAAVSQSQDSYMEAEESAPRSAKKAEAPANTGSLSVSSESDDQTIQERMIIYNASYSIQVESVRSSIDKLKNIAKQYSGFIQNVHTSNSYNSASITLRIPVKNFENAVEDTEQIGNVTSKSIRADDITDKFTDLNLRMESLIKTRKRLYELLARTKKPKDRIKVLKEISRISTEIEQIKSSMEYLKDRADYSTITVSLKAFRKETSYQYKPSPFDWIRNLSYNRKSTEFSSWDFKLKKPSGFFNRIEEYKKGTSSYLYLSPGSTAGIRIGTVDNYPKANMKFWEKAFTDDAQKRLYKKVKSKTINNYSYNVYRVSAGYYYAVAYSLQDDKIVIAEAYFKNKESYEKYESHFIDFIKNSEYK